jgi:lipopolysaccharide assembly outer membrane protein LptD (OstA)
MIARGKTIFILTLLLFYPFLTVAAEELPLGFEADGVLEYIEGGNVVIGRKNVRLTYGDVRLRAEEVKVNIKEGKVLAKGDAVLILDKDEFKGSEIEYNFEEGKGKILKADTFEDPWYIKADLIEKTGEREYLAYDTKITSCEFPAPHYHFSSKKIKLYPHERIWIENAVMWIGRVPVFYLPIYTRSLKGKPYGLVISPGYDTKKGFFLLSHYNWYINRDLEGRIYFDPVERQGLGRGLDVRYGYKGTPLGYIYAYQMREDNLSYDSEGGEYYHPQDAGRTNRWKAHARHWQNLGAKDSLFFEVNKFSDKDFHEDFYSEEKWRGWEWERLKDYDQQNVAELSHREKNFTFSLSARKQLNSFFDVTERLPEVNFDLRRTEILPHLYLDLDGNYVYLREKPGWKEMHRSDALVELSRPVRVFGWLNLTPAIADRVTWYNRGAYEKEQFWRHYYGTSIGMDTRLYKIQHLPEGRIEKKRHIVEPRLTYYYYPDINMDQNKLFNFDSVDRLKDENRFSFQLINRWQGKDRKTRETIEWIRAISETGYDIKESSSFSDFRQEFLINPHADLSIGLEAQYDFHKSELEMINSDIYWEKEPWEVSLGSTYYLTDEKRSNLDIEEEILWKFSRKWHFGLGSRYDLDERHLEWLEFSVHRDLHCWQAQFLVQKRQKEFEDRDELRFYLAFTIKALPDKLFDISQTTTLERKIRR